MKIIFNIFILFFLFISCGNKKKIVEKEIPAIIVSASSLSSEKNKYESEKKVKSEYNPVKNYKASRTKINDLVHTVLDLKFNYEKQHVYGKATITLSPHYYSVDSLVLNAKGFDIHIIKLKKSNSDISLKYQYNNSEIVIQLDKLYTRNEKYTIFIDYTAKPNELPKRSSLISHDDKGLYFINPGTDNPQIWTQGETQSNSCWFPTIDAPNQKMTQEIYLTVKREFKTLSNGKLHNSLLNSDGTRTDHWKQDKAHAPYLAMIAVGKFIEIKNYWRDMPVFVYVQEKDKEKAQKLFHKTHKMIEFFSDILDYDYPWDKYSQIVVEKFVSGAMENTGATVFSNYYLYFNNEQQRISMESTVAHELSHHWFGDLVTCESWANLPLNEAFATYFEYLWIEHEYGREEADNHLRNDYNSYMFETIYKNEHLIRFYHKHRDDMFDGHSYQKGGMILHMLRYTVGDEAFFDALELYLKRNEYKSVEIHDLRLAFEEVTGQDLNWFFNQWFLNKGYPSLDINYSYDNEKGIAGISIKQTQKSDYAPIYKLIVNVDIYLKDKVLRKKIIIDEKQEDFYFKVSEKPELINFDADKILLCKKNENKTKEELITQLKRAPLFSDKKQAFEKLKRYSKEPDVQRAYLKALDFKYWYFRLQAIKKLKVENDSELYNKYIEKLKIIAEKDNNESVRKAAKYKIN